ncbi:T9SS type A sorting domain-containing protein [Ignavibacterium sp.]|uniref:T9SS type A sorting domain-containing protein n=1 Tax=Ignavibacterium sp. TaxID=2651167 RepID=UPI00220E3D7B|nr:T9SS type A sorting domain-containing protein [Ignavibacterium sp.]BDQ03339.1 MAG: hypothetical protein KatS3mg037_1914 [Ignavibacterium sp.]
MKSIIKLVFSILIICNYTFIYPQYQKEWQDIFSFLSNSSVSSVGVGSDNMGNLYIGGTATLNSNNSDFLIIKYNSQGDTVWTRLYDINSENTVLVKDFFVDSLGNCYLTGSSTTTSFSTAIVTIKFNSDGVLQFSSIYNTNSFSATAKSLIVDDDGSVLVLVSENTGLTLIKYNFDGSEVWTNNYVNDFATMTPEKMVMDNNGFILVGGSMTNPNNFSQDFFVMKLNSFNGDSIWTQTYDRAGFDDYFSSITVDNQGNIFIGGSANYAQNFLTSDFAVVKLNSDGQFQWARFYNGNSDQRDEVIDIISDSDGNIFVGGNSYDPTFLSTVVLIKYSPTGDSLWAATFNGDSIIINSSVNNFKLNKVKRFGPDARFFGFTFNPFFPSPDLIISGIMAATATSPTGAFALILNTNSLLFENFIAEHVVNYNFFEALAILSLLNDLIIVGDAQRSLSSNIVIITTKYKHSITNVENLTNLLSDFTLDQNYPNPFNPYTKISWQSPVGSWQTLKVYDVLGNEVAILVDEYKAAGNYSLEFNGGNLPSGVYIYKLIAGSYTSSKKMVLMK